MRALTLGGVLITPAQRDAQIARFVASGIPEIAAVAWIDGLIHGGKTDAEALGLLRDKDVPQDGVLSDACDLDDSPADRWLRDAWTRSHNGGPIPASVTKARKAGTV